MWINKINNSIHCAKKIALKIPVMLNSCLLLSLPLSLFLKVNYFFFSKVNYLFRKLIIFTEKYFIVVCNLHG